MTATPLSIDLGAPGVGRRHVAVHPGSTNPESATTATRARWERPAFFGLLVVTAVLYLWGLSASGWANTFYAAAAQAGSESWTAFLYGASDAAGSITVDKPPAAIWVMALSVRLFGLSSWSILVPQALMGVATVAVLYRTVRRRFPAGAALLAGAVLALTPAAALMFRFNNPDALLVLLITGAVAAVLRAVEGPRTTRWMMLAGALVGLAFLTKQLQAFLVLPSIALVFLWAAPVGIGRRIRDSLLGLVAMVVAGGWWVALVELVPESMRPYIGGSQTNSFLELTFGYNGLGRITGDEEGSVGGGMAGGATSGGMWGTTGISRLFEAENGGQITWLVPAAVVLALAALWVWRRAPRTDARRAAVVMWLSLLLVTGLTFSFMAGIFHAYYDVALAPAIAALVGIGGWTVWAGRRSPWALWLLAAATAATTAWAVVLLGRSADWLPWLRWTVLAVGILATLALAAAAALPGARLGPLARVGAVLALVAGLAGPTAYALQTVGTAHTGSIVTAGPTVSTAFGGMRGAAMPGGMTGGGPGGMAPGGQGGQPPTAGQNGMPGGGPQAGTTTGGTSTGGTAPGGTQQGGTQQGGMQQGQGGGMGGLLGGTEVSDEVRSLLLQDADDYTWAAAVVGSQSAASYQLATEESVMPVGGFNGSDPSPTLEQFQEYVAAGEIHWFVGGGGFGGQNGGSSASSEIAAWVEENFAATTVDGVTLYDLSGGDRADSGV